MFSLFRRLSDPFSPPPLPAGVQETNYAGSEKSTELSDGKSAPTRNIQAWLDGYRLETHAADNKLHEVKCVRYTALEFFFFYFFLSSVYFLKKKRLPMTHRQSQF